MAFLNLHRVGAAALLAAVALAAAPAPAHADDDRKHWRSDRHHDGRWDRHHDRHWDRHHDRRHHRGDWNDRDYRQGYRDGRRAERRWDRYEDRRWERHHDRRGRVVYREVYRGPAYGYGPRHYGPPRWARGYRIHDYGWAPTYVVVDYGRYGLRHPPRGYHWRRDDRGDWLLVAIATGIVADVILNR